MPDPTGTHSDGAIAWGTQVLTINGQQFTLEKGSMKRGTRKLQTMDGFGRVNAKVYVEDPITDTITLQVPGSTIEAPAIGATVPIVPLGGGAAINFMISEVGEETGNDAVSKISCTVEQKVGS